MAKYKKIFDKKVDKYGQSAVLHKSIEGIRCPCYDEDTGYCTPQWHRDNPEAPECNDEGYINAMEEDIKLKAFIFPQNDLNKKLVDEAVLANIGILDKDDYIYVGKSDLDISNLKDTDYLIYKGKRWQVLSPDGYEIGDETITYVARLKPLGSV